MNQVRRSITLVVALLALVVALPGTAVGQTDEYRASGQASGFTIELPGGTEIAGARSEADIASDLLAHARGVGFLTAEGSISEVRIEQADVTQRDPETGENCAGPELPEPVDLVDIACSVAEAETVDGAPSALSDASGVKLALTGADVVALVDFLLGHIDEAGLDDAIDEVEAAVIVPARKGLADACLAGLGELGPAFDQADELISEIESGLGSNVITVDDLGSDACTLLIEYIADPPVLVDADGGGQAGADDLLAQLRDALAASLEDVSLLDVLLGGSTSEGLASTAAATGSATAIGVDVALPSLNLLGNLIDVLTTIVDDFVTEVEGDIQDLVDPSVLDELPALADLVDTLLAAVPAELQDVLDDDQSLLRITGGQADVAATFDRVADAVSTEGQVAPLVIDLADTLAVLLGVEDQDPITIPEGDDFTLAEGTPLETTARLATCTSEEATEDGLDGERIGCDGLELVLLKGLVDDDPETDEPDGGLRVAAASAQAAAFGAVQEAEGPEAAPPTLPTTGGGVALAAVALLGLAVTLRRRR